MTRVGTTTAAATATRWTLAEVQEAFAEISPLADQFGYAATLFGSTLKTGDGRDLDVVMISRFAEVQNWRKFLWSFGGVIARRFDREDRGGFSFEVERGGKLYHFIFGRF